MKTLARLTTLCALSGVACLDFNEATNFCFDAGYCKQPAGDPPSVIATAPTAGKTGVGVNQPIVISFSREMDPTSATVQLTPPDALSSPIWDELTTEATFVPAAPLRFNTQYTARVNAAAALDQAALKEHVFSFTTGAPPDTTPPTLVGSLPANGATAVALNSSLQLDFSEAIDPDSLTLISNPPFNFGAPTWMTNARTVRFLAPVGTLMPQTQYTLAVDVADVAGNPLSGSGTVLFTTTAPPDTMAPTVISVSPPAASTGISTNTNISFSFSEPVRPTSAQAFSITPTVSNVSCTLDVAGVLMTCAHPATPLAATTAYTVRLRSGADGGAGRTEDLAGNPMAQDFVSTFTTSATPDTMPPTVMSVSPTHASNGAAYRPLLQVTFSEAMDKAATQAALVVSSPGGVTGNFSWDATGRVVTFAPSNSFAHSTTVSWQVGTGAKDLAGNSLAMTQLYTFQVRRNVSVTLTSTALDGYVRTPSSVFNTQTYAYVGDNSSSQSIRGFVAFDFAGSPGIPTNALGVVSALLEISIFWLVGDPRGTLGGPLYVESIPYAALTSGSYSVAAISVPPCVGFCFDGKFLTETEGRRGSPVPRYVEQALPARRIMFRLRYPTAMAGAASDYVGFYTSEWTTTNQRPTLTVVYEVP